jgi:hypothetical protein
MRWLRIALVASLASPLAACDHHDDEDHDPYDTFQACFDLADADATAPDIAAACDGYLIDRNQ